MAFVFQKVASPEDVHAPPQRPPPRRNPRQQRPPAEAGGRYHQQHHHTPPTQQQQQYPGPPPGGHYHEPYFDQGPPPGSYYGEQPGPGGWNQMQQHYPAAPPGGGPGHYGPGAYGQAGGYGPGPMEQHNVSACERGFAWVPPMGLYGTNSCNMGALPCGEVFFPACLCMDKLGRCRLFGRLCQYLAGHCV